MPDTTINIEIPKGAWADLYDLSGIAVGTQIIVKPTNSSEFRLWAGAAAPTQPNQGIPVRGIESAQNDAGDAGAWLYSVTDIVVNVRAA